jgi:hypothetical protein
MAQAHKDLIKLVFQYPQRVHVRRHGPRGYTHYQSFKPWLRDEFEFRCVYCLWRERWLAVGEEGFGVEHLHARQAAPERICDYDNLAYACCRCNAMKADARCVLDPVRQAYGQHLEVRGDGTIQGLTAEGRELIQICKLDRPRITQARARLIDLFRTLQESAIPRAATLLQHYLAFPDNLPVLTHFRPPDGNSRPSGIAESYAERRRRNELAVTY